MKLPKKLGKPPIVDAVFEMRFAPGKPLSNILPGLLYTSLNADSIERLPAAQLPELLREIDENMKFAPLVRVHWATFMVQVSDRSLGVSCKIPYSGWTSFKSSIAKVTAEISKASVIDKVERHSLKYTNIVSDIGRASAVARLALKLGDHDAAEDLFLVRAEIPTDRLKCIVQIAADGTILLPNGSLKSGVVIDVDTLCEIELPLIEFARELDDHLERIHDVTKSKFFNCLQPEALEKLEPIYD
ncbi:MAG: hypothetical protein C5B56_12865 [Proteobacteria bacterium]|nr:MAG: hypothetical protein C5B56_12865 [Pseudomonadota bacterium]